MRAHDDRRLADSLWRFSLALYARAGVAQALIVLQDAHGFDINLILLGLWAGAVRGVPLADGDFVAAAAADAGLRRLLIEPLRGLRRELKQGMDDPCARAIRQRVLSIELRGEREVQACLVATLPLGPKRGSAAEREARARANLAAYIGEARMGEARTVLDALHNLMRCG